MKSFLLACALLLAAATSASAVYRYPRVTVAYARANLRCYMELDELWALDLTRMCR
jgi:hypothetical protein